MNLSQSHLFLGFPLDDAFISQLNKLNPAYKAFFLQSGEEYLTQVDFQGTSYIGKYVKNEEPLSHLEQLETNIFSLLKKLVADFPYQNSRLILFALPKKETC